VSTRELRCWFEHYQKATSCGRATIWSRGRPRLFIDACARSGRGKRAGEASARRTRGRVRRRKTCGAAKGAILRAAAQNTCRRRCVALPRTDDRRRCPGWRAGAVENGPDQAKSTRRGRGIVTPNRDPLSGLLCHPWRGTRSQPARDQPQPSVSRIPVRRVLRQDEPNRPTESGALRRGRWPS